jgi:hypothetical protein
MEGWNVADDTACGRCITGGPDRTEEVARHRGVAEEGDGNSSEAQKESVLSFLRDEGGIRHDWLNIESKLQVKDGFVDRGASWDERVYREGPEDETWKGRQSKICAALQTSQGQIRRPISASAFCERPWRQGARVQRHWTRRGVV